mgnify:CR=1 FL=1
MKPDILIVADFPDWAFYEIQQFIKNNLSDDFNIYSDYLVYNTKKKSKNPIKRIKTALEKKKYQEIKKDKHYDIVVYLAFYFEGLMLNDWTTKHIIKGVYTDGFPPQNSDFKGDFSAFIKTYFSNCNAIICGSEQIHEIYKKSSVPSYNLNVVKDTQLFKRISEKQLNLSQEFIIGWTGNPNRHFKGLDSHIIPAIEIAKKKYPGIELKTRFSGSFTSLPRFFDDVDLVLIASNADADPSLFGEASLMEVPSISTSIGRIKDVIVDNRNGFIVNKDSQEMADKILYCYENRAHLLKMSKQIRNDFMIVFDPAIVIKNWKHAFNKVLRENL